MDLQKLLQELEALQQMDTSTLSPEQLTELLNKISDIADQSEQSLLSTSLLEINKIEEENEGDHS